MSIQLCEQISELVVVTMVRSDERIICRPTIQGGYWLENLSKWPDILTRPCNSVQSRV